MDFNSLYQSQGGTTNTGNSSASSPTATDFNSLFQQSQGVTQPTQNVTNSGFPGSNLPTPGNGSFFKGLVNTIANPFLSAATSVLNFGQKAAGVPTTQPFSSNFNGQITPIGPGFDVSKGVGANSAPLKDTAATALQAGGLFAPEAEAGASLGSKILGGAAQGYAMDTGAKLENQQPIGQALEPGLATAVGAALPGVGAGLGKLTENLPNWFIQKALPKLDTGNIDFAKTNLSVGTVADNLAKSEQAVQSSGNTINSALSHPQYANETGNIANIVKDVTTKYPNAQLNENIIANKLKSVAPLQKDLVDKVLSGEANLVEQNQLRQTLDRAIYPKFTDTPSLTANKQIAKIVTDSLRSNVQTTAPETAPMFAQFSKEINLNKALKTAQAKIEKGGAISLYDLAGFAGGGAPGILGERLARSPGALISSAKGVQALGNSTVLPVAGEIGKRLLMKGASTLSTTRQSQ